jgi:chorismate mutase
LLVSVEGRIGERAPRTTMFPAFIEELLPGGGYSVRHVLSNKSRRTWTKIEDGCRVQAPLVFSSPRESTEDRSHKHFQLAVAEARAKAKKCRASTREMQRLQQMKRVAAENKRFAEMAMVHSTFASLVEDGVAAKTAHLQTEIEAVRREALRAMRATSWLHRS